MTTGDPNAIASPIVELWNRLKLMQVGPPNLTSERERPRWTAPGADARR